MKNVSEIYNFIGQTILESISENWKHASVQVEVLDGYCSYSGDFETIHGVMYDLDVLEFPENFGDELELLHSITTEGGHNRWNRAIFKLWPDGKFDMEFIWDQDLHDEIERLS